MKISLSVSTTILTFILAINIVYKVPSDPFPMEGIFLEAATISVKQPQDRHAILDTLTKTHLTMV